MEVNEFKQKYNEVSGILNKEKYKQEVTRTINKEPLDLPDGGVRNLVIAMEECAELIQRVSEVRYGDGNRLQTIEEIGDVCIAMRYIQMVLKISDVDVQDAIKNLISSGKCCRAMECCAYLIQQVSKAIRGKIDKLELVKALGGVTLAIEDLRYVLAISEKEVNKAINVKLKRLESYEVMDVPKSSKA